MNHKWGLILVSSMLSLVLLGTAVDAEAQNNNQVTQGELALMLINMMALHDEMDVPESEVEAVRVLLLYGISPAAGWDLDRPVVLADLAVVLVKALGAQGEVDDANDPAQCIAYLEGLGVPMDTVSGAVLVVPPRGDSAVGGTSLRVTREDGMPDTDGLNTALSIAEIRQIIIIIPDPPPRPRPVTPD